jgi:methionine-rich copper-binding protein CopC
MKRSIAAVLGLALALVAHAHTQLKTSSPAADAAVTAPKAVELEFAGDVRLTSVSLTDSAGAAKHLDAVPTDVASTFS